MDAAVEEDAGTDGYCSESDRLWHLKVDSRIAPQLFSADAGNAVEAKEFIAAAFAIVTAACAGAGVVVDIVELLLNWVVPSASRFACSVTNAAACDSTCSHKDFNNGGI